MKVGVGRADLAHPMFRHERGGVKIVENVAGKPRLLRQKLCENFRVHGSFDKDSDTGRIQ